MRPPPPTGTITAVEVVDGVDDLEADRALPCDDARIVERMHQRQPALLGKLLGEGTRLVELIAVQHHVRPEHPRLLDLGVRRRARHDDGGRHAEPAAVTGKGLGMIAGRHGDDALGSLLFRQLQQAVKRASFLERRGELKIFELQEDVAAGQRRKNRATGCTAFFRCCLPGATRRLEFPRGLRRWNCSASSMSRTVERRGLSALPRVINRFGGSEECIMHLRQIFLFLEHTFTNDCGNCCFHILA